MLKKRSDKQRQEIERQPFGTNKCVSIVSVFPIVIEVFRTEQPRNLPFATLLRLLVQNDVTKKPKWLMGTGVNNKTAKSCYDDSAGKY